MVGTPLPADDPFFAQWSTRVAPHSLEPARVLKNRLRIADRPTLTVVGSKGKGSAACGATAALVSAGLSVVTVSSPAHVTNRERIRVGGTSISESDYETISAELASHLHHLPPEYYLCPSGAYTVMGAWWADQIDADVLVLEEGMGGSSDEISLFSPSHLVVTPIFAEHVGELGDTLDDVIADLLGVPPTTAVTLADQDHALATQIVSDWPVRHLAHSPLPHRNRLVGEALGLGWAAGADLASTLGAHVGSVPEITLPGRSSVHDRDGHTWVVDGAVSPEGVRALLDTDPPQKVIACWPTSKDWQACADLVPDAQLVRTGSHLPFPDGLSTLNEVDLSGDITFVGTQSFVGEVLTLAGVETDSWF